MKTKLLLIAFFSSTLMASAQTESQTQTDPSIFDGIYIGLIQGRQNVFGGSFVNDMDILAQETKNVTELALGFRKQILNNRLVLGIEAQFGFLKGDLSHANPQEALRIAYNTNSQRGLGFITGVTLGPSKQLLLFGYLNETKRKFDVDIVQGPYAFSQTDQQGMLKYGIGLEHLLWKRFRLKASYGGLRVDFGDLATNIDVEDKYDFNLGLVFQF